MAHALFASGKVVIPDFLPIFSPFGAISKLVLINEPGEFLDVEKDPLDEFSVHLFLHRPALWVNSAMSTVCKAEIECIFCQAWVDSDVFF